MRHLFRQKFLTADYGYATGSCQADYGRRFRRSVISPGGTHIVHTVDYLFSKALITLLADANDLWRYVDGVPDVAFELIDAAVRPLTVIYDKALMPPLAPNLPAADGSFTNPL